MRITSRLLRDEILLVLLFLGHAFIADEVMIHRVVYPSGNVLMEMMQCSFTQYKTRQELKCCQTRIVDDCNIFMAIKTTHLS